MERDSVRRCRRCGEATVVVVDRWEARLLGVLPMRNEGQTDHQCQSCGARFSLRPWLFVWFLLGAMAGLSHGFAGALALLSSPVLLIAKGAPEAVALLVVGAVSLAAGLTMMWFWAGPQVRAWRNPVVPGAPMVALRFDPARDSRRCSCGVAAPAFRKQAHSVVRLPVGTQSAYACPSCGRTFSVPSGPALVAEVAMTLMLGGLAVFLALLLPFSELNGGHFLVLGVLALGSLMGALVVSLGLLLRARHPSV